MRVFFPIVSIVFGVSGVSALSAAAFARAPQSEPAAVSREVVARDRLHDPPRSLLEVVENVAFTKEAFAQQGLASLTPENASPQVIERITPIAAELMAALPENLVKFFLRERANDATVEPDLDRMMRARLSAVAHWSLVRFRNAGGAVSRRELLDLLHLLESPADKLPPLPRIAIPDDAVELDETLATAPVVLRCIPYVLFAALHDPGVWGKDERHERDAFIADLMTAGEARDVVAAAVLDALVVPFDGTTAYVRGGERTEHPFSFEVTPELAGRVGFTEGHLDMAAALEREIKDARARAVARKEPDPYSGERAFLPDYSRTLALRIRLELLGANRLIARLDRPEDLIAIWKQKAETYPWPALVDEFERYFGDALGAKLTHPVDAELLQLEQKSAGGPLTDDEVARWNELHRKRVEDMTDALRGILDVVGPRVPADHVEAMFEKLAHDIDSRPKAELDAMLSSATPGHDRQATANDLASVVREQYLLGGWTAALSRAPSAAKTLLESKVPIDPVGANAAITALWMRAKDYPEGIDTLFGLGMKASDPEMRSRALSNSALFDPQQAEKLFSAAIDDVTRGDPATSELDRNGLGLRAIELLRSRGSASPDESEWIHSSLSRVFESGLWATPAAFGRNDAACKWAASYLSDAQVAALEASGKLPAWVKELRATGPKKN